MQYFLPNMIVGKIVKVARTIWLRICSPEWRYFLIVQNSGSAFVTRVMLLKSMLYSCNVRYFSHSLILSFVLDPWGAPLVF